MFNLSYQKKKHSLQCEKKSVLTLMEFFIHFLPPVHQFNLFHFLLFFVEFLSCAGKRIIFYGLLNIESRRKLDEKELI